MQNKKRERKKRDPPKQQQQQQTHTLIMKYFVSSQAYLPPPIMNIFTWHLFFCLGFKPFIILGKVVFIAICSFDLIFTCQFELLLNSPVKCRHNLMWRLCLLSTSQNWPTMKKMSIVPCTSTMPIEKLLVPLQNILPRFQVAKKQRNW